MRNYFAIIFFLTLITGCKKEAVQSAPDKTGKTYYIDSKNGNDSNDGLSPDKAWNSLSKAGKMRFEEGDIILLKKGCTFKGKLSLQAEGTKDNPVKISSWPENDPSLPLPVIDAKRYPAGISVTNCSFLEIENIEIISDAGTPAENEALKKRYGVLAISGNGYQSSDIVLRNLYIHDIYASKEIPSGGQNPTSNRGMGIYFESNGGGTFKNISIEKCRIENTGHTGIKIRAITSDTAKYVHGVNITDNRLKDIGGPGIQPGKCINVTVRGNVVDHSGSMLDPRMHGRGSGIWPWYSKNVLIEHNTFMYAHGKMDSHGVHIDHHCNDVIVQYNMSIGNEGGFVEILGENYNCSYRYNISVNDGSRVKGVDGAMQNGEILFISNYTGKDVEKRGPFNNYIYNNTIYVRKDIVSGFFLSPTTDGLLLANNIFCILGETQTTVRNGNNVPGAEIKNVIIKNNLYKYHGTIPPDFPVQDSLPLWGDPEFVHPGGINADDYIPANAAIVKDKGIIIKKLPGDAVGLKAGLRVTKDILGNPITGNPDMGAIEIK